MEVTRAAPDDLPHLARLLWLHASPAEQARESPEAFAGSLGAWRDAYAESHVAFLARVPGEAPVGMAWVALLPRVPRPGTVARRTGDIQSVYVVPAHRGKGIGAALVAAATSHALQAGAARVTVASSSKAVPVYERLGFASSRQLLQTPADG